jgi:hypothetical protein
MLDCMACISLKGGHGYAAKKMGNKGVGMNAAAHKGYAAKRSVASNSIRTERRGHDFAVYKVEKTIWVGRNSPVRAHWV